MAPLPTISGVMRCALIGQAFQGVKPINVIHIHAPSGSEADLAAAINDLMPLDMWYPVPGSMQAEKIQITKLDGSSATQEFALAGWNAEGGDEFIPEAAAVVSLRTTQRGPRGRGRVFIGPVGEANTSSGTIGSTTVEALGTAWNDFSLGLAGGDVPYSLGVASYAHSDFHTAETITCDVQQATQRRRLLQQR